MDPINARSPVPLVVCATAIFVYAGEYLGRAAFGEVNELAPLTLTLLVLAAVATAVSAALARGWSRAAGIFVGLAVAWAPYASAGIENIVLAITMAAVFVSTASLLLRARAGVLLGLIASIGIATAAHYIGPRHRPQGDAAVRDLPDIVLLVLDTTRRDRLTVYGYEKPTTPNLERFAERARVYDDAWSVAPWTSPSHASMFTGLLPGEHGVDGALAIPFPDGVSTLPAVLADAGYRTGGFPANANLFASGWQRGFHVYLPPDYQKTHTLVRMLNRLLLRWREPADHAMTDRVLARARAWWDDDVDVPRFLFINVIDPHSPYVPTDEHYRKFVSGVPRDQALAVQRRMRPDGSAVPPWTPRETDILSRLYDAEIADMDRRIGRLIDWLDERGDLDDTLFVITSDHGERLGERGLVGHRLVMDPYLLRVPLLVRYPAKLEPARISKRVQLDGLPGFILRTAGLESRAAMRGFGESDVAVAQHRSPVSIVDDMAEVDAGFDAERFMRNWCYVARGRFALEWSAAGTSILTDVESDPNFTRNVAGEFPEEAKALAAIAKTLPGPQAHETRNPDPELIQKLKTLGYVQ